MNTYEIQTFRRQRSSADAIPHTHTHTHHGTVLWEKETEMNYVQIQHGPSDNLLCRLCK